MKYQTLEAPNGFLCFAFFQVLGAFAYPNNDVMISILKDSISHLHLLHSMQSCVLLEHPSSGDMKK
jgi:hypothetical protein